MALHLLPNALLLPTIHFYTISQCPIKQVGDSPIPYLSATKIKKSQEPIGTIATSLLNTVTVFAAHWLSMIPTIPTRTCTMLMMVRAHVYDVWDGHAADPTIASTVITLSDWYHVAAKLGPSFP